MVETGIMLIISYDGERMMRPLSSFQGIDEIKTVVAGKWSKLELSSLSLFYTIGRHTNVVLGDEDDYHSMIQVCNMFGSNYVDIAVKDSMKICVPTESPVLAIPVRIVNAPVSLVDECFEYYQSVDGDLGNNVQCSKRKQLGGIGTTGTSSNSVIANDFRPPAYDLCPDLEPAPLLSDGWDTTMEGPGQVFRGGRTEFREALVKYATKLGFQFKYDKNNTRYVNVSCKAKESLKCNWFIRGVEVVGTFVIKKAHLEHTCVGLVGGTNSSRMRAPLWSKLLLDKVRNRPTLPGKEMIDHIKVNYGVDVPISKVRRSVDGSRATIFGAFNRSWDQLGWYSEAAVETNPGSIAYVNKDPDTNIFENAFFCFAACLEGFKHCRPLLFIDATFMKGRTQATIFSAIAKDGNNGLFPVAFAITTGETLANWTWFLRTIKNVVKNDLEISYVSDRNAGLLSAFNVVWDNKPNNFFCLYHLHSNLKNWYSGRWGTEHREKMCSLLTDIAYAPNMRLFDEKVQLFLQQGGVLAQSFLDSIPYDKWAVAYSPNVMRYGEMTSNAAESFNSWILIARSLPITYMVDTIRRDVMRWFVERRADAAKWSSILCTRRQDMWNHHVALSRTWTVKEAPNGKYEVWSKTSTEVDLEQRSCTCSQWEIHGFPCPHAAAVIMKTGTRITEVVESYFFADSYMDCYAGNLNPIPGSVKFGCPSYDTDERILPPLKKNMPGRPNKKRKRANHEGPRMKPTICTSCGLLCRHDPITCRQNTGV